MSAIRKVVCIQYPTGKTVKRGTGTFPETKLLTVGSAFLTEASENGENKWMIQGRFHAVPPQWDGKFILLDPLPKSGNGNGVTDDDVPF